MAKAASLHKVEYLESEIGSGVYENIPDPVAMEEKIVEQEYLRNVLKNAITSLSDREKEIVYKIFWEGKNREEVAEEIGVSKWVVYKIYDRALKKMRKVLCEGEKLEV